MHRLDWVEAKYKSEDSSEKGTKRIRSFAEVLKGEQGGPFNQGKRVNEERSYEAMAKNVSMSWAKKRKVDDEGKKEDVYSSFFCNRGKAERTGQASTCQNKTGDKRQKVQCKNMGGVRKAILVDSSSPNQVQSLQKDRYGVTKVHKGKQKWVHVPKSKIR
ncbi:hypothetical protein QYF36_003942 [Acer negundo]|nr:hypothetical protein QYF36_003942 [Acer negundo]